MKLNDKVRLEFYIELSDKYRGSLDVTLKIYNWDKKHGLNLIKGNMHILDIRCSDSENDYLIAEKGAVLNIYFPDGCRHGGEFFIDYTVSVGYPGKHGLQGFIDEKFIIFEGSKVLLLPSDLLLGSDDYISEKYESIVVNYNTPFPDKIAPFYHNNKTLVTSLDWMKCYDLRSSTYAFGRFFIKEYVKDGCRLKIYTCKKEQYGDCVFEGIYGIFNFFCNLFFKGQKNTGEAVVYNLVLLDHDVKIMGGSGISCAGYGFDPQLLRDWELLGHRMFHAFFDQIIYARDMRIPPQLWLYEGLASFYEIECLKSLKDEVRVDIGFSKEGSFRKLALRYLYFRIKDEERFALIPMEESKYIRDNARMEFLHYTQAPLLVYLIEKLAGSGESTNVIINEILKNKRINSNNKSDIIYNPYDILLKFFTFIGREEEFEDFFSKYLYGNEIYPLDFDCDLNLEAVINEINYYNYVVWSWSVYSDTVYEPVKLTEDNVEYLYSVALNRNIKFADEATEKMVKRISPALYKILKAESANKVI